MSLSSLQKGLILLDAVVEDGGRSSVASLARSLGMPVATAHRHISALVAAGYLSSAGYGRHIAGPRLCAMVQKVDEKQIITNVAAPILNRLAAKTGCVVQLGTFENDMVTYRLKTGESAGELFTKVGMQLEAYCSGIGKVLLAHLPAPLQKAYLATGPFPALTPHTITDSDLLKDELDRVVHLGFALDDEEVVTGLQCVAVPVPADNRDVIAAISASRATGAGLSTERLVPMLKAAAAEISHRVG